jgi:hypothetical protein
MASSLEIVVQQVLDRIVMKIKMSSLKQSDKKAVLDFAAWSFNVTTSVGIIMVNQALMATYGFSFGILVFL